MNAQRCLRQMLAASGLMLATAGLQMAPAAESPAQSFELAINGGTVAKEQRLLRVDKGTAIKLRVSSDAAGSLHLHAYKLEVRVVPGTPAELSFTARATGRFRFEWHADNAKSKSGDHHGPPLATLEVRPR
jgi:heme/copper-type cytochrome/quinol oxidase subunit 2